MNTTDLLDMELKYRKEWRVDDITHTRGQDYHCNIEYKGRQYVAFMSSLLGGWGCSIMSVDLGWRHGDGELYPDSQHAARQCYAKIIEWGDEIEALDKFDESVYNNNVG